MVKSFSIIVLIALLIYITPGHSSCLAGVLTNRVTKYGTREQYCEYQNMKFLPGSKFRLAAPDCMECSCSKSGLQCCGFGFAAGTAMRHDGCVAENDACKLIFVKENNRNQTCAGNAPNANNKKKKTG